MSDIRDVQGDPNGVWDDLSWTDLSSAEQDLWGKLGWNESNWEGETDPPASSENYWEDLDSNDREVLEQLGYTQELWDNE